MQVDTHVAAAGERTVAPARPAPTKRTVYGPPSRFSFGLTGLWMYRWFAFFLGWGYIRKLYRGTWLGWLWIPLRPGIDLATRALVFGGFLGVSSGNRPYLIYLTIGTAGWSFFDRAAHWGFRALQFNQRSLTKVQVPWLAAVVSTVVPALLEAGIAATIATIAAIYYKITQGSFYIVFNRSTGLSVVGLLLLLLFAWSVGVWTAPLVARVRDVRVVLRYFFGFLYFITPVLYPPSSLSPQYRGIAELNPLSAPILLVQHGLLDTSLPGWRSFASSLIVLAVALPLGLLHFARAQRRGQARL